MHYRLSQRPGTGYADAIMAGWNIFKRPGFFFGLVGMSLFGFMLALAWTPGISFQEDLGRHLLLGKIILQTRSVPDTNLLTYTHPDYPFLNHHWLSEVLLYVLHYGGGLNGLILWKMAMMVAALALAWLAVPPYRCGFLYGLAGLLAAVLLGFRAHIRPELFTYLLVALFLWLFERIRAGHRGYLWLLLVGLLAWVNLHIYFVFGLGMTLVFLGERIWIQKGMEGRKALLSVGWMGAAVLVCLINPHGWKGLAYPLSIFHDYGMQITENESPCGYWRTVLNPMLLALPLLSGWLILAALTLGLRFRKEGHRADLRPANLIIALVALGASWSMARSVPLLALTSLPVIGAALRSGTNAAPVRIWRDIAGALMMVSLGGVLIWSVVEGTYARRFPSPIAPTSFGFDDPARYEQLGRFARRTQLAGPVFSDYNLGSLVEYALYPEPGYVDNRPEAFPSSFWHTEYLPALVIGDRWEQVVRARRINAIIVSFPGVKEGFVRELMRRPEWLLVYFDDICGVWVRNHADNKSVIDSSVIDHQQLDDWIAQLGDEIEALPRIPWWRRPVQAEKAVYQCYSLLCLGQGERAWPWIEKLHRMYPDYQIVHELMRASAPPDQWPLVEQVMKERARWPLAAKQALDYGRILLAADRTEEARSVFQRGRYFFPLSIALREEVENIDDADYLLKHLR